MTSDHEYPGGREQDEILAGEYVLGVLSLAARRRVEDRMAVDSDFAQMVERWQADLAPFNDAYENVVPNNGFEQIEQRLFGSIQSPSLPKGLWDSAAFWRWLSLGTSAAAIAALVYASGVLSPPSRSGEFLAEMSAPSNMVNMLASYDAGSGRIRIVPVAAGRAEEKSLELWLVPGQGDPLSLGVFPAGSEGDLVIPADLRGRVGEGAVLAVTLEPFGGSPTGRATGPIVASGTVRRF